MSDEKAPETKAPPQWQHDQQINFNGFRELMIGLKEKTEQVLEAKKKELSGLLAARDSLTRK